MAGTIGIKIANGDFYPIIEENALLKKRLVLTTVHDRQESVQIDLFRSLSKSMLDAQYIGSLIVENMKPRPKGEPSIEMVISCDMDGTITADAYDLDSFGEHHTLNVSLKNIDNASQKNNYPDFDLGSSTVHTTSRYGRTEEEKEEERKFPWLIMGLAAMFVIIVIAILWFLFRPNERITLPSFARKPSSQSEQTEPPPPPSVQQPPQPVSPPPAAPEPQVQPSLPAVPPPVIQAPSAPPPARVQPAQRTRPPAPVLSYRVPAVIPKNGVVYQIQWGDTLWDISAAFYRNPWLYPRIARYNNIRNPDLIISGFNVRIPPLN